MTRQHLPKQELERLSAYIDGEIHPREARKLEARLNSEPALREAYQALQAVASGMRALPQVRPPRSFILSPEIIGVKKHRSGYPALRLATVMAAFAFVALVGVDAFTTSFSGGLQTRSFDQIAAEAPAMAESETLGAAKSEASEPEALLEEQSADMLAGADAPEVDVEGEALAMAPQPEGTEQASPVEESMAAEQERLAEPQVVAPEAADSAQDELPPAYGATEQPPVDSMLNQLELEDDPDRATTFAQPERVINTASYWLRGFEIGLGGLTIILGALTFWTRKRSR